MIKHLALVLALAACGGGSKKDTTPVAEPTTEAATTGATLGLAELKILDVQKNKALLVHADGTIEIEGQKPAKVTADGKLVSTTGGEVGFTLEADGSVKGPNGVDTGAKISPEGALTFGGQTIAIDDAGMITGGNADAPPLKVEGATSPETKRTAMLVLLAMMSSGEDVAAPTTSGSVK